MKKKKRKFRKRYFKKKVRKVSLKKKNKKISLLNMNKIRMLILFPLKKQEVELQE